MSASAAPHISGHSVIPVSNIDNLAKDPSPGFYETYETVRRIREKEARQKRGSEQADGRSGEAEAGTREWPEIFKLLQSYLFEDFLQLALSKNDSRLNAIIKKSRILRGVSSSRPVSARHAESENFIKQMASQYKSTGRLMRIEAEQRYCGVL